MEMRRIPASVLMFVFSYMLIMPLLLATPESNIPECCRREGKHHCAKLPHSEQAALPAGPGFATKATCPLFPAGASTPVSSSVALPPPRLVLVASIAQASAPPDQPEALHRISAARSWQKRGPPSLLT